jgi:hypothetical protein
MAKKAKGSAKREKPRERKERQFEPAASGSKSMVYLLGALGALLMGAGTRGQFESWFTDAPLEPWKFAPFVLAAGALLVGVAIWLGTSGEAALRVGDGGIAVVKSGVRRMPWYAVERISWHAADAALVVTGKDELNVDMTVVATVQSHAQAAAWIVKEARERIPARIDGVEDVALPDPLASAGTTMALEPPQVVGRHCAASGKVIAYEPDARVCVRCERVYHRTQVPETCECGASLVDLQPSEKSA